MLKRTILSTALLAPFIRPSSAQTPFQGEGGRVRVLSFPTGNDYPFWAISRLGLDRKYGFELDNVPIQPGGAVMTAFRSGATEGGLMNWLEIARARSSGEEFSAVVPFLEMPNVWVVPTNSPARALGGLEGLWIGTVNRFSPDWVL